MQIQSVLEVNEEEGLIKRTEANQPTEDYISPAHSGDPWTDQRRKGDEYQQPTLNELVLVTVEVTKTILDISHLKKKFIAVPSRSSLSFRFQ